MFRIADIATLASPEMVRNKNANSDLALRTMAIRFGEARWCRQSRYICVTGKPEITHRSTIGPQCCRSRYFRIADHGRRLSLKNLVCYVTRKRLRALSDTRSLRLVIWWLL
jgi:hypothetical protein